MLDPLADRFPFAPYPTGWFQIAYSNEIDPGAVVGMHYFGQRLLCYRGSAGEIHVLDAYCPHMGADISVGGVVEGDCVVCPFHGWQFDGTGRNVDIPYAPTLTDRASLRSWPVREVAGMIFVWHSDDHREPDWELPDIPESADPDFVFHAPEQARWRFRSHPQEVFENTVDVAHFATVHGVGGFGALDVERDEHRFRAVAEVSFTTPRGLVEGAVDSELFGMGIDVVRHRGLGRSCTLLTVTPIDGEMVDARYTFFVELDQKTGEMSRMGMGFARDFCKQIEQDIPIWENKVYRKRPQLASGEAAVMKFRRWAERSYAAAR